MSTDKPSVTIDTLVHAPLSKVWSYWTEPVHIMQWNAASDDWCCPAATNDLRTGGTFTARMEARDKSMGFDFGGTYTDVIPESRIAYTMGDGRAVEVTFVAENDSIRVVETFEIEQENSAEMQRAGWQSILDRFKAHVERS